MIESKQMGIQKENKAKIELSGASLLVASLSVFRRCQQVTDWFEARGCC